MKKVLHTKSGVAVLLSDKIDFKTKTVTRNKEGYYIMIKGLIQEDITIVKGEIDGNTIIVGDFNTPLTSMDRSSRQKINKATEILMTK